MVKQKQRELQRCLPVLKPVRYPIQEPFSPPRRLEPIPENQLDELEARKKPRKKLVSPLDLQPKLVQEIKDKYYKNFTITVGAAAFTNQALGLRELGIVADTMCIISYPAGSVGISYKMNAVTNDITPIVGAGQEEDQFEIEEIYLNDDGAGPAGNLIIRVTWNPYLIRLAPS